MLLRDQTDRFDSVRACRFQLVRDYNRAFQLLKERENGSADRQELTILLFRERHGVSLSLPQFKSQLSAQCVFKGTAALQLPDRSQVVVRDSEYLILNDGQKCKAELFGAPDLEWLMILFGDRLVESIISPLLTREDVQNFGCSSENRLPIDFIECIRSTDHVVTPSLSKVRELLLRAVIQEDLIVNELTVLLQRLLHLHRADMYAARALPLKRENKKLDMFARLHKARDYIVSAHDQNLSLDDMANEARLSTFHFQRSFFRAFKETPHQFLQRCRLERARRLLSNTEKSITDICLEVGFESLGSFSTLFSQHYGASPRNFRQMELKRNQPGN